jgi:hypothetical protein
MRTLGVPVVPTGFALGAPTLVASAQVHFRSRTQTDLTPTIFNARAELFVPPTGIRREDGHAIAFTEATTVVVEIPAVLVTDNQAAAGTLQCQITGKPPVAQGTSLGKMALEYRDAPGCY